MTASSRLKIAVVAPIPSARVDTATVAKPGDLRSPRSGVADVLPDALDHRFPPGVADAILYRFHAADLQARGAERPRPGHAASHPVLDARLEKLAQLRVQLVFDLPASKESA